ncbi:MAG TPA: sulfide/dihydroorotate dehydrogenase-like FAD/NAD-binding protein [Bacilli bacterium]|nr:sulfide/dihydroorotate dehydrogenase-like FAD/NAD-binding protein [Bacilli bacterium]
MFKIILEKELNKDVKMLRLEAEKIAKVCQPGQFVIIHADEEAERIPLTIADYSRTEGWITIIFQLVGAATLKLAQLGVGDNIRDVVGPLGKPSVLDNLKKVCVIGGGAGCAIALPVARGLQEKNVEVHSIIGFRNKDLLILAEEFKQYSDHLYIMTDDGSAGELGLVTTKLAELIAAGHIFDEVIAIGPLIMMKFVALLTKKHNIKTVVSMNPIMIDGTGMCGCCRLTVGGKTKFACVDGPDFDGHEVDFDEAMMRNKMYVEEETASREETCNLFKGVTHE